MDKKKMILTSLASVAVLGAAFAASQPSVVKAVEDNTATASSQPAGATDTSATNSNSATNPAGNSETSGYSASRNWSY